MATRKARTRWTLRRIALLGAALAAAALLAAAVLTMIDRPHGEPRRVTVPRGAGMAAVADSLAHAGLVRAPRAFRVYAAIRGGDREIKPGTYLLRRGSSWHRLLETLRGGGRATTLRVIEGYAVSQIVTAMATRLGLPIDSIQAAVADTALRRRLDVPTPTVEGYLFPDTYDFTPGTSARVAVAAMVARFEEVWQPEWTARLDSIPMSRHDAVTLASIVEREARLPEERPVIAAVYLNRLRRGMLLQADPTVQYALGQHQARLLYRHLTIDSPYNTYRNKGLPPGPIGSPGAASLRAAVYPADVPYLFFVAFPDGHHEFRRTYAEHLVAVRAARRAWDAWAKQDSLRRAQRQGAAGR